MTHNAPAIGWWLPTAALRVAFAVVAAVLCALVLAPPFWRAVGLALAVGGLLAPTRVPAWWLVLLFALGQLGRDPVMWDVTFHLLLAGVPLLHLLGSLAREAPWVGRLQVAVLARPLRRWLTVQLGVQPVAVVAFGLLPAGAGTVSGLPVLAAVALGVVAVALAWGGRRAGYVIRESRQTSIQRWRATATTPRRKTR